MSLKILYKLVVLTLLLSLVGCSGGLFDPKGHIAFEERNLILVTTGLMLLVVIPVIFMTFYFAWKYRASQTIEKYEPKWAHSKKIEIIVWFIPIVIVTILAVITWYSTHALDPYKPLENKGKHLEVQVVSMNWKWLFIYPELGVASVNELAFPKDVPLSFKITSAGTMNSFFIPQLGSQIYSMAGMETKLHLIADEAGTFDGFSANYSGHGFTGMKFKAIATETPEDFDAWVKKVKESGNSLTSASYAQLAEPSENNPVEYFGSVKPGIFHEVIMQFMQHHAKPSEYYYKPEGGATGNRDAVPAAHMNHMNMEH